MNLSPQEYADLVRRHPKLAPKEAVGVRETPQERSGGVEGVKVAPTPKPLLNATEKRYRDKLLAMGIKPLEQAITLRLDPPFKSYRPDLAYQGPGVLVFVEVKGRHRFREKGIAKCALAAKTYPQFCFKLAEWTGKEWEISAMTP